MGGGTTPTSGNAAGSMNTFADYSKMLQGDQALYSGIAKGIGQFGSGIAAGGSAPPAMMSAPGLLAPPSIPESQFQTQIPVSPNSYLDALQRMFLT